MRALFPWVPLGLLFLALSLIALLVLYALYLVFMLRTPWLLWTLLFASMFVLVVLGLGDNDSSVRQSARSGNRPNMSWCSTQNRQDGFVLAVPKDSAKPLHRLQRFKTLAECNETGLHAAFFRNISVRYGGTPQTKCQ